MKDDKNIAHTLGENLKRIRTQKNISRKELAEGTGASVITIGEYERGNKQPPLDRIFALADYLKVSVVDLTGNNGYIPAKISADKQIFEYRYKQAFESAILAGYSPVELDGGVLLTVPSDFRLKKDDGSIEVITRTVTFKIKDKETFVNIIEKVVRLVICSDLTFLEAFLLSNPETNLEN